MRKERFVFSFLLCFMVFACGDFTSSAKVTNKEKKEYAERVKSVFGTAWSSYMKYARGMDAVNPISGQGHNWYSEPLLMTPVDAFSTMCIMGLEKEKEEAKDLIFSQLNFDKNMSVQQFEIAIRILGGLLSSYQLDGDPRFLALAEDLGRRMLPVFDSPTGIPYRYVNLSTGAVSGDITNPCEVGSMLLEYGMLSVLTGNPVFYEKCKRGVVAVFERRDKNTNLVGSWIDVRTGEWTDGSSHISGGIDAYYEYLLKGWLLFGDKDLKEMWDIFKVAIDKYLADDLNTGFWYGRTDMRSGKRTGTSFCALDCFYGAVLCLDGNIEKAEKLQASVYKMWTLFGIEPESLDYTRMTVENPCYMARPEAIESTYYNWIYTGKEKYYEQGKVMFESIEKYCRTDNGFYSQLGDVRTMDRWDTLESFFFAETLKYCYLFFAPSKAFNLKKCVLNTEAHPFFYPSGKNEYLKLP
ncbi:MAG: glycoside hydrolase family 47 protein [Candidatus Cryptobacteroides sp.]